MINNFLSDDYLNSLAQEARLSTRLRKHCNIHQSYFDPCQRLLNAIGVDSYIQPHRHSVDLKLETLIAIQGYFALVTFDRVGVVQAVIRFGTEQYRQRDHVCAGVEIDPEVWHTVIALEPDSILLELKNGPFDMRSAKELALWAPKELTKDAKVYLASIRETVMDITSKCNPQ